MRRVLYSKFSSERKKEYRIATQIVSADGKKSVIKMGLNDDTKEHIKNIADNRVKLSAVMEDENIELADVVLLNDKELEFEYIDGIRMDSLIEKLVKQKDYKKIIDEIKCFTKCITNTKYISNFECTKDFEEVFGDNNYDILKDEKSFDISNIDLIFENIIIRDKKYVVTDYEWVFDFKVPVKYIVYRSILLNSSINSINDKEIINGMYEAFEISKELMELFYEMEKNFQFYVSNKNIFEEYNKKSTNKAARIMHAVDILGQSNIRVYDADKKNLIEVIPCDGQHIEINCDIKGKEGISLEFDMQYAVIKIESVEALKEDMTKSSADYKTNADLEIGTDYYFKEKNPSIEIKNNGYNKVYIKAFVYFKDTSLIGNQTDMIFENAGIREENSRLKDSLICREQDVRNLEVRLAESEKQVEFWMKKSRPIYKKAADYIRVNAGKVYKKLFGK